jgi:uncharacterized membrane protein
VRVRPAWLRDSIAVYGKEALEDNAAYVRTSTSTSAGPANSSGTQEARLKRGATKARERGEINDVLPGLKAALNYHAVFVHFPIVLWLAALLFQLLALWRGSDEMQRMVARMLYLGTLAAIVTVLTGLAAANSVPPGEAMRAVGIHETLMLVATSVAVALCMFAFFARNNFTAKLRKFMLLGLFVLAVLLTIGADRGAQLVYGYGAAVNWSTAQQQK